MVSTKKAPIIVSKTQKKLINMEYMLGDNILSFSTDICNMKYVGINQKFLVKYFRAKFQAAASDKSYSCHTTDREI